MPLKARLARLERHARITAPDPHRACFQLWQARIAAVSPPDHWADDVVLPAERPTDGLLYPKLECFVGPDADCVHNRWADYCFRRDRHLFMLKSLDEADTMEFGPEPTPEALTRQREQVAAYVASMTRDLPRLESRLARIKGGQYV